jgi:flagellar hook-associated protein 1 FlgK
MSIFSIGKGALSAAQAGLLTAGHNIANANTAGYSRQRIEQITNPAQYTGGGYLGSGTQVATIRRQYDALLANELRGAQSLASQTQAWLDGISRIDGMLADPLSGLSPAIDAFFAGVHDVASRPGDAATRQNLLSAAQTLAGRFRELDGQLSQARQAANARVTSSVAEINSLGRQIAQLNRDIIAAGGGTAAQPPNDLLDQRDRLVAQLAEQVGVSVVGASDGSYSVFLGTGQALVLGAQSFTLAAQTDPLDAQNLVIGLQTGGGMVNFAPGSLTGGELGGILGFRDQTLSQAQNALGRLAVAMGEAVNEQHRLGMDRNGALGGNLFAIGAPAVYTTSAATVGAAISDPSALSTSDYRLAYDGANYTLTRLEDGNATVFAAFPQTIDGVTLSLAGPAPAAGDTFLIQPTRGAASALRVLINDPAQVAAAAPIRTSAPTANTGTATISAGSVDAAYLAAPIAAPVTLTYDAATGMLSGLPATPAFAYTAGAPITWNGITFSISGAPGDGDTFVIQPNAGGSGDNRNMVALASVQLDGLVGGATLQQTYGALTSIIGNRTRELQVAGESQTNLLTQVQAAREGVSGVNLDEEASDLMRYQQAYQAAGKLISVASTLFDTILGIGR